MRNLRSSLRARRAADPMREFDRLPPALRRWLAQAALPWSAPSVRRAWVRALGDCDGCETRALERLCQAEARLLRRDAPEVWGTEGPPGM